MVEVKIREGLATTVDQYTLTNAMADLEEYYNAGSIPGALASITEDSGSKAAEATVNLKDIKFKRTAAFATDIVQLRVNVILAKIDALENDRALELSKNPPVELVAGSDVANSINLRFLVRPVPIAGEARELLGTMVVMGDRTDEILKTWEDVLSETE